MLEQIKEACKKVDEQRQADLQSMAKAIVRVSVPVIRSAFIDRDVVFIVSPALYEEIEKEREKMIKKSLPSGGE